MMTKKTRRDFITGVAGIGTVSLQSYTTPGSRQNTTLPHIDEVDICVLGGSCPGVFAAVRTELKKGGSIVI